MEARPTPSTSSILGILGSFLRNYPQPPARHGDLTLKIILNSSRESAEYNIAIRSLLSSESIQKSLQRLSDDSAIERMLDVLDMESQEATSGKDRRKASILLQKMCKKHGKLPSSFEIKGGIELEGSSPSACGGFGQVWKARYDGGYVAIKLLKINLQQDEVTDKKMRQLTRNFCHEAVIWKRLSHPNLVPFLGVDRTLFNFALVSKWMEHGTILPFVKNNPGTNRLKLLHDVACGLSYLHDISFVHSDIKSANVLIDSDFTARISDFGCTNIAPSTSISMTPTLQPTGGTCRWMAPEVFFTSKLEPRKELQKPSKESDVYSFGMLAYELFAHRTPFAHLSQDVQVIAALMHGERPARPPNREPLGLNDGVWDKIQACWDSEPKARPTIEDMRSFLEQVHPEWVPPPALEVIDTPGLNLQDTRLTGSTDQESSEINPPSGINPTYWINSLSGIDSMSNTTIRDATTVLAGKILDMYRSSLPGMTSKEIIPLGGAPLNDDSGDDHQVTDTDSDDDDLDDKPIGVTPSAPGVHPISSHSVGHSDSNPSGNNENEDLDKRPVN